MLTSKLFEIAYLIPGAAAVLATLILTIGFAVRHH
jgi:hypothetical protein